MLKQIVLKASFLVTISVLGFTATSSAQTKLVLLYKRGTIKGSLESYMKPNNPLKWSGKFSVDEFTVCDSLSFFETVETFDEQDELSVKNIKRNRKSKILGKNFIPNAVYCNYVSGYNVEEIEWKDDNYRVKDGIADKQKIWNLTDEKRIVFGYTCKKAYTMNDTEIDNVVWYTDNFKCSYSPTGDTSLPGTILESYFPKTNTLITAIDFTIEPNPMMFPKMGALVTRDEFKKIQKGKKS